MANYRTGVVITNVVSGVLAGSVGVFTAAFVYLLIKAILATSFNMTLTANPGAIGDNFIAYGFISIEAVFVGVVVYLGVTTVKNALAKRVIEIEVD